MLEQDVQLTRLIVEKLTDLDQRRQQLSWQLTEAQERLDQIESLRTQRSAYENVLERAAALLGRDDLRVEIEVPVDDSRLADELRSEISVLDAEQRQYLELVDELRQRAPTLLEAAAGMAPDSLQSLFAPPAQDTAAAFAVEASEDEAAEPGELILEIAESRMTHAVAEEDPAQQGEAELQWTPPAFRPAGTSSIDEVNFEDTAEAPNLTVLETPENEASPELAAADGDAGAYEAGDSTEAGADAEPDLNWPAVQAGNGTPSITFEGSTWDDADVEVVSQIDYDGLANETASNGAHFGNGHYSNGSHAHEVVEDFSAGAAEAAVDAAEDYAADPAAESESGWSDVNPDTHAALATGAAGFVVESEGGQTYAMAAAPELDYSADFDAAPSFAADDERAFASSAEGSALAVEVASQPTAAEAEAQAEREEDARERLIRLSRFNYARLRNMLESSSTAFVIDATAVLERIPHYDRYHLALDEAAARDELVRDFSFLAAELAADFHLVFNDPHSAGFDVDPHVRLESGDANSGDPNPGDLRIQEIVLDYIRQEQPVALVTSDPSLQNMFKGENVVVFSLGEFFLT